MTTARGPILEVDGLGVVLRADPATAVLRGLSFTVERGETLAIVGESGCGKSVTSLAIMGLLPPALVQSSGALGFDGAELPTRDGRAMRRFRGRRIGMAFQEPMSSLNPVFTIGDQVMEVIREHEPVSRAAARTRALDLLAQVQLPDPRRLIDEYPHRLSGGQRQRVVIAIAIACRPDLLIADEPTTALDVTVQAQIVALLKALQREMGIAIVLITHNLGLVAQTADRVMVMYAGQKVEEAKVRDLFAAPRHPYTTGLLGATPRPGRVSGDGRPLREIRGVVPSIFDRPPGCPFRPRCDASVEICAEAEPALRRVGTSTVACHVADAFGAAAP